LPPQFDFVFRNWAEEVKADPALAQMQPYKALIEKDPAFLGGGATQDPNTVKALLEAFSRSWAGQCRRSSRRKSASGSRR